MVKPTLLQELEDMGEAGVRKMLMEGKMGAPGPSNEHRLAVELWLAGKAQSRAEASADKRDLREEDTLAVAKEANDIARSASFAATAAASAASEANTIARRSNRIAIAASIIAAIAAIAATYAAIKGIK